PRGVEERPRRLEASFCGIPGAAHVQDDGASPWCGVGLKNLVEGLVYVVRPLTCVRFFRAYLDGNARRRFRILAFGSDVSSVRCETWSTLSPAACERDAECVKDGCLSGVVGTDEDGGFTQVDVELLDRAEVLDPQGGYPHCTTRALGSSVACTSTKSEWLDL